MSLTVNNSRDLSGGKISALFYGVSGVGKSRLLASFPNILIIVTEEGMKSTVDLAVDTISPSSWEEILQIIQTLKTHVKGTQVEFNGKLYDSIGIDSLTALHTLILKSVLRMNKREMAQLQDWGLAGDRVETVIQAIMSLPVHFGTTALEQIDKDEIIGKIYAAPMIPGKLSRKIPALFDEVFQLRLEQKIDGKSERVILTQPDSIYMARDRSGKLAKFESFQLEKPRDNELWKKISLVS